MKKKSWNILKVFLLRINFRISSFHGDIFFILRGNTRKISGEKHGGICRGRCFLWWLLEGIPGHIPAVILNGALKKFLNKPRGVWDWNLGRFWRGVISRNLWRNTKESYYFQQKSMEWFLKEFSEKSPWRHSWKNFLKKSQEDILKKSLKEFWKTRSFSWVFLLFLQVSPKSFPVTTHSCEI